MCRAYKFDVAATDFADKSALQVRVRYTMYTKNIGLFMSISISMYLCICLFIFQPFIYMLEVCIWFLI